MRGVPARRQQKKSWLKKKKKKKERKVKKKEEGRGRRRERRKRNVLAPVTDMYKHRSSLWDNWIHVSRISEARFLSISQRCLLHGVSFSDRCSPRSGEMAIAALHDTLSGSSHKGMRMYLFW